MAERIQDMKQQECYPTKPPFSVSFQWPTEIMEEPTHKFAKSATAGGRYEDIMTNLRSGFLRS
jgi:hypothetical protein